MVEDKCKECARYAKCKLIVDTAKKQNSPLLALQALVLCPLAGNKAIDNEGK